MHSMLNHAILILAVPLFSAAIIALFLRKRGTVASWLSTAAAAVVAILAIILLQHGERFPALNEPPASFEWLRFGDFSISLGIKFDDLAALMLFIVGFVGFLIHLF